VPACCTNKIILHIKTKNASFCDIKNIPKSEAIKKYSKPGDKGVVIRGVETIAGYSQYKEIIIRSRDASYITA
jgi:hypothetical protein